MVLLWPVAFIRLDRRGWPILQEVPEIVVGARSPLDYLHQIRYDLPVDYQGENMKPVDLVQGTLDLLILRSVSSQAMHGWSIAQRIQRVSNEQLQVQQGSLYPALHRLEQQGWLKAEWGESDNNRRAKFYSLTSAGRKKLAQEIVQWDRLSAAISLVIREA